MITKEDRKLGNKIRRARKAAGITQEQLSETVKITPKYVQYVERAKRNPSLKTLRKIAKALRLKISDLLT